MHNTASLNERWKDFEFQLNRNYYVDLRPLYLAFKLNFVQGRYYEVYKTKEIKKEQKEKQKQMRK